MKRFKKQDLNSKSFSNFSDRNLFLNFIHSQYLKKVQTTMTEEFRFNYKGVEYDATDYAEKHPGGLSFLKNMKAVTKDFTQYFRALHSDEAEKILKSFRVIDTHQPTKSSQEYMEIYKKVQTYHEPLWSIQILLCLLLTATWTIGLTSSVGVVSVLSFAFTQILIGWVGHSAAHNRNKNLNLFGRIETALLGGFSLEWWSPKHNMHHMFTNITKYDEDIQHEYKVYLYPFLYLKWRFDSLESSIKSRNWIDVTLIITNYVSLYIFSANFLYFIIGGLIAGFYSAYVLIGNHEREIRFAQNPQMPFIDHQIVSCRNYNHENLFWLLLMGGMQYQTEHHLFPQVPFYRLPTCKNLIKDELSRLNKTLIYGPVL